MSLIQEALRRQQEEAARQQQQPQGNAPANGTGPSSGQPEIRPPAARHISLQQPKPPTPPPIPTEPNPQAGEAAEPRDDGKEKKKAAVGVLAVVMLVLLLSAGLVVGGWKLYATLGGTPQTQPGEGATNAVASPEGAVVESGTTTVSPAGSDAAIAVAPAVPVDVPPVQPTGDIAAVSPATPPSTEAAVKAAAGAAGSRLGVTATGAATGPTRGAPAGAGGQPVAGTKPPATPQKPQWPPITLTGFLGRGDSGTAILNGQMVGVSETINGVEVVGIEPRAVRLRFQGETRLLRQGQTTEP